LSKPPPAFNTTHVINQLRVRYFKPLVCKEKARYEVPGFFFVKLPLRIKPIRRPAERLNPPYFSTQIAQRIKDTTSKPVLIGLSLNPSPGVRDLNVEYNDYFCNISADRQSICTTKS
jgi:hypothetical protein